MFLINIFPHKVFGGFGVENESIEIKDQGFEHDEIILSIVIASLREAIPQAMREIAHLPSPALAPGASVRHTCPWRSGVREVQVSSLTQFASRNDEDNRRTYG